MILSRIRFRERTLFARIVRRRRNERIQISEGAIAPLVCTNPYVSLTHPDGIAWQAQLISRSRERLQGFCSNPKIAPANVTEVNNEVVHQQRSYIVFSVGRICITCGCTRTLSHKALS